MASVEAWRKKRAPIKAKLTRMKNSFAAYNKDTGLGSWAIQLEKFEPLYNEFDAVQTEIEMLLDGEDIVRELKEREEFEGVYFDIVLKIREFVQKCRSVVTEVRPTASTSKSPSQNSQSVSADISNLLSMTSLVANLPTLTIPKFDGSFKDWVRFRDSFKTMVHERTELSNIQKFHHLSSSLTGDAARVIQSLGVSEANYELAWKNLIDRYEDSRSLIHFHVKSLFDLPIISKVTCVALRQLIDDANNHLLALKSLGESTESWDTIVTYLLSTKLDFVTKRDWEKRLLSTTEPQTFTKMIQFLEGHCKYLQRITADKTSFQIQGNQPRQANSRNNFNNKNPERLTSHATTRNRCLLCEKFHALANCEKLLALPVNARIGQIAKLRVCFNCLKPGHRNKDCTSSSCEKCPGKHNTVLHIERNNSERIEEVPATTQESNGPSSRTSLVAHSTHEDDSHVLLGTAIVYVKDRHGNRHECRALLDSCSQVNLMTQDFCNRLRLPVSKSEVIVSGVFKSTQEPQNCAQVTLKSRCTNYSSNITCLIAPEITDEMPNIPLRSDARMRKIFAPTMDPTSSWFLPRSTARSWLNEEDAMSWLDAWWEQKSYAFWDHCLFGRVTLKYHMESP